MNDDAETKDDEAGRLLEQIGAGELGTEALMTAVYAELRGMADRLMVRERAHHTLQPTALVHEAFLRLVGSDNVSEMDRLAFLEAAAVAMRRVLVDHARGRDTQKRGAEWQRVTLQGVDTPDAEDEVDVVALHEALVELEALDPRQAKVVELRFFGGMTGDEIATRLGVSRNTVVRELELSRAWLRRAMSRGG